MDTIFNLLKNKGDVWGYYKIDMKYKHTALAAFIISLIITCIFYGIILLAFLTGENINRLLTYHNSYELIFICIFFGANHLTVILSFIAIKKIDRCENANTFISNGCEKEIDKYTKNMYLIAKRYNELSKNITTGSELIKRRYKYNIDDDELGKYDDDIFTIHNKKAP